MKLFSKQCLKTHQEEDDIFPILYANVVGSLTYKMDCTRKKITCCGSIENVYSKSGDGTLDNNIEPF